MKKKLVLRPFVLPTLYITLIISLMIFTAQTLYKDSKPKDQEVDYVTDSIFKDIVPVINMTDSYVLNPYSGENVVEKVGYYNYQADEASQEMSIIQYENTYLQNTGITYYSDNEFKVVAIMDGTVSRVYENDILGKIVELTHENNVISVYQMLNDVKVNTGDVVQAGEEIATSGKSKISNSGFNLHFEVYKDGNLRDPKTIIGVNTKDL